MAYPDVELEPQTSRVSVDLQLRSAFVARQMHKVDAPSGKLMLLSLKWPSSLSPFKSIGLTDKEREWIKAFSCRKARCFKPCDRATVLQAIREKFVTEDAFDDFVHEQLLTVLERSKREYATKLSGVASESFGQVFGS